MKIAVSVFLISLGLTDRVGQLSEPVVLLFAGVAMFLLARGARQMFVVAETAKASSGGSAAAPIQPVTGLSRVVSH